MLPVEMLPVVRGFIQRRLRDPALTEDVVQNVFVSIHRFRHTYRAERPLEPWMYAIALNAWLGFPMPSFGRAVWSNFLFLGLLSCLAAVALGGTLAALTGAVPGREPEGHVAAGVAIAGLLGAIAAGIAASVASGEFGESLPIQSSLMCALRGAGLGLLPVLAVCLFLGRSLVRRPTFAAALALFGATGLGACFVHASCTAGNAVHMLLGHAAAPLSVTLVLLVPCVLLVMLVSKLCAPRG
jgi:hypothetical protein